MGQVVRATVLRALEAIVAAERERQPLHTLAIGSHHPEHQVAELRKSHVAERLQAVDAVERFSD